MDNAEQNRTMISNNNNSSNYLVLDPFDSGPMTAMPAVSNNNNNNNNNDNSNNNDNENDHISNLIPNGTNTQQLTEGSARSLLDDNAKKLKFKNLIKEKVLKPSKLPQYSKIKTHHSHLVIRDSHYLIKSPTSFITCASCHRGRVLKIASIQESTTEDILKEVYSTISKNPCSKRKQTLKDSKVNNSTTGASDAFNGNSSLSKDSTPIFNLSSDHRLHSDNDQLFAKKQRFDTSTTSSLNGLTRYTTSLVLPLPHSSNSNTQNLSSLTTNGHSITSNSTSSNTSSSDPSGSTATTTSSGPESSSSNITNNTSSNNTSSSTTATTTSSTSTHLQHRIPNMEEFFDDFEEILELQPFDEMMPVKSLGRNMKVTSYTLTSLFNGTTSFPTQLDFFLSLAVENGISKNFFTPDTLIIPLPTYSNTIFMKDFNKDHLLKDDILSHTIHTRIQDFVSQPNFDLHSFKIIIVFNYFQEGLPERPHENQSHKYVGNTHVIHAFNVLEDSSLCYTNSRYSYNHNYTWIDSKEEWYKTQVFNELIIKKVQNEIFLRYQQDLLGSHIHPSVLERGSIMNMVNYTVDESYVVTPTASLFVTNFITLKILRVLTGEDGLQLISYLMSVKVNCKHNLHLLKLLLGALQEKQIQQQQQQLALH